MANMDFPGAVDDALEALNYERPTTEAEAVDVAQRAIYEYIDRGLTWHSDVLEAWDGSTHENVDLSIHDDIMTAITESVAWQLQDDLAGAEFDAIDEYIETRASDHHHTTAVSEAREAYGDPDGTNRDEWLEVLAADLDTGE